MKRVLSLLLAFCLIPVVLAVPVGAATLVPASLYDLLGDVDYRLFYGSELYGSYAQPLREINTTSSEWRWNVTSNHTFGVLIVAVIADTKPASVKLFYDGSYHELSFLYTKNSTNKVHYYQLIKSCYFDNHEVRVSASWSSTYTGVFGIDAFYGYVNQAITVTSADFFCNLLIGDPALGYRFTQAGYSGTGDALPAGFAWCGPYEYDTDEKLLYGEFYYKVKSPLPRADSITFMVYSVGALDVVGCRLDKSDGNTVAGLDCDIEYCGENQVVVEFYEEMYRSNVYMVTADLSGQELGSVDIVLSFRALPVDSAAVEQFGWGVFGSLQSCAIMPEVSDTPWWSSFGTWLNAQLTYLKISIDNVTSSVRIWGQNIVDALSPADPGSDQFKDDLQQVEDDMSHLGDVMNSVTRPDINQINPDVGNIVKPDDIALAVSPLTVLFDDPNILSMFVLSFIMALGSFVLFGKR